jgi:hypothetical protein
MYNIVLNTEIQIFDVALEDRMVLKGFKPLANVDGGLIPSLIPLRTVKTITLSK